MDKKISELDQALQINNDAVFPMSQDNGGEDTTYKASITQLSTEIGEGQTFSNLQTTNKTLVGAINELLTLGNPIIIGTTAPTAQQGDDGNLYVQYTEGVGGADDTVDGIFIKLDGTWCEIQTGGSGGHTIVDAGGTDLPQRANLQFIGAYSEDNSVDDTTEVNVVREMTKAQFDQLTAAEKVGLINVSDVSLNATKIPIESGSSTNTKAYIDSGLSGKADTSTTYTKSEVDNLISGIGLTIAEISSTSDGKNYQAKFGSFATGKDRIPVLVLHSNQSGTIYAPETVVLLSNGGILTQSGAHVTSGASYRMTIDNGTNAWASAMVIYPSNYLTVQNN